MNLNESWPHLDILQRCSSPLGKFKQAMYLSQIAHKVLSHLACSKSCIWITKSQYRTLNCLRTKGLARLTWCLEIQSALFNRVMWMWSNFTRHQENFHWLHWKLVLLARPASVEKITHKTVQQVYEIRSHFDWQRPYLANSHHGLSPNSFVFIASKSPYILSFLIRTSLFLPIPSHLFPTLPS